MRGKSTTRETGDLNWLWLLELLLALSLKGSSEDNGEADE